MKSFRTSLEEILFIGLVIFLFALPHLNYVSNEIFIGSAVLIGHYLLNICFITLLAIFIVQILYTQIHKKLDHAIILKYKFYTLLHILAFVSVIVYLALYYVGIKISQNYAIFILFSQFLLFNINNIYMFSTVTIGNHYLISGFHKIEISNIKHISEKTEGTLGLNSVLFEIETYDNIHILIRRDIIHAKTLREILIKKNLRGAYDTTVR